MAMVPGMRAWHLLRFLLFPGAWLAGVVLVSARATAIYAVPIAFAWGVACYITSLCVRGGARPLSDRGATSSFRDRTVLLRLLTVATRLGLHLAVILIILVLSALITIGYQWATWDPVGEVGDLGWGAPRCHKTELSAVSSGGGLLAALRRTECPIGLYMDTDVSYFIFVLKPNESKSARNLVFRYYATVTGVDHPPSITWVGSSLRIVVGNDDILEVTKQRAKIDAIAVDYSLGRATYPAALHFWQGQSIFRAWWR
jgi:hypothetical protein